MLYIYTGGCRFIFLKYKKIDKYNYDFNVFIKLYIIQDDKQSEIFH